MKKTIVRRRIHTLERIGRFLTRAVALTAKVKPHPDFMDEQLAFIKSLKEAINKFTELTEKIIETQY